MNSFLNSARWAEPNPAQHGCPGHRRRGCLAEFGFPGNRFIRIALAAYEEATGHYAERGPRAARAIEKARGGIFATWSRDAPSPMEDTHA